MDELKRIVTLIGIALDRAAVRGEECEELEQAYAAALRLCATISDDGL